MLLPVAISQSWSNETCVKVEPCVKTEICKITYTVILSKVLFLNTDRLHINKLCCVDIINSTQRYEYQLLQKLTI